MRRPPCARRWTCRHHDLEDANHVEANCRGYCRYEIDWGRKFAIGAEFGVRPGDRRQHHGAERREGAVRVAAGISSGNRTARAENALPAGVATMGLVVAPDSQRCVIRRHAGGRRAKRPPPTRLPACSGLAVRRRRRTGRRSGWRAEIVDPPASGDATPGNNAGWIDVVVTKGGTSGPVKVGAVKLSRPRPSYVVAQVAVTTAAGLPVAPKGLTCTATFVGDPTYRGRPLPSARPWTRQVPRDLQQPAVSGKTLRGTLTFSANSSA